MKRSQLILLLLLSFLSGLSQKKYYFSADSGDTNNAKQNGSITNPFESLNAFGKLQLKAGDTVFFRGGDVFTGTIRVNNVHGSLKRPIVFTAYGKGKTKVSAGNSEGFVITESDNFLISNFILYGAGRKTGNTTDGLKLVNCNSIKIRNLEIAGFQKAGLQLFNCRDAEINGVIAQDNGHSGILVEGDYQKRLSEKIHFVGCRANNNPGDPTNLTNHSGNGIVVGNCRNVLIEYCTATNNGWDMPRIGNGPVGIWAYEADSVIIQNCISYRNKTAPGAADGGGFDLDGGVTNSIIQYCLSYENEGSGYGIFQYWSASNWKNNTVRYCISINDGRVTENASGMYIWNGNNGDSTFTDFYAYNNLFYNDTKYSFSFSPLSQHKRFYFFNNVFVSSDISDIYFGSDSSTSDIFLNNVWMRKNGGFMQNESNNLEKWARTNGYEFRDNKFYGITFDKMILDLPKYTDITDPYSFKTDPILSRICNNTLLNKGLDLKKMFGIDPGKQDFFGNLLLNGKAFEPGVFELK